MKEGLDEGAVSAAGIVSACLYELGERAVLAVGVVSALLYERRTGRGSSISSRDSISLFV